MLASGNCALVSKPKGSVTVCLANSIVLSSSSATMIAKSFVEIINEPSTKYASSSAKSIYRIAVTRTVKRVAKSLISSPSGEISSIRLAISAENTLNKIGHLSFCSCSTTVPN